MNAKFEKWLASKNFRTLRSDDGDYAGLSRDMFQAWQAAIRSIEVTPDLVTAGMNAQVGPWTISELVSDPNYLDDIVEGILTAAITKLKEQV